MPTNDEGNGDAQEATEDKTSDDNNDDVLSSIEDEEVREKVRDKLVAEREQKKHWRGKAKDSENASADGDSENDETDDSPDVSEVKREVDQLKENQKLAREGYSDEEIAEARAYAQGKDMSVTEAVETEFVQSAIQQMRKKNKSQENTPSPSSQVQLDEGKDPSEVLSDDEASDAEKDAALQKKVQEQLGEGRASHE